MKHYVYIGRFQIIHKGHEAVIENAMQKADKITILIGSANIDRSEKNPFFYEERNIMVENSIKHLKKKVGRDVIVEIKPIDDFNEDEKWKNEVIKLVDEKPNEQVLITGCKKIGDTSTFYLDMFPEWKKDFIVQVESTEQGVLSSTELRKKMFNGEDFGDQVLPENQLFIRHFLQNNQ